MKHCDKCDVQIADNINHCPLCGRDISGHEPVLEETFECYPNNKIWVDKRNFSINLLLVLVLIGTAICIGLDLFFNKNLTFSWYVITGVLIFVVDIILPLKKRWCFSAVSTIVAISICAYILFIELYTQTFGWGLIFVIPFFLLFMCLYSTSIILARNYYKGFDFFVPLIIFTCMSIAVFIFNLVSGYTLWPSLVVFLTSIVCTILIVIFRFKKVKQQIEKNFFV